jgi:hypothetical protein
MAELAIGLVGAAATVGAANLTMVSGFTGRHERSHREEMLETDRNMGNFRANLQSGEVTTEEERDFLRIRDECVMPFLQRDG